MSWRTASPRRWSTYADDDSLFPAHRAGARGYLTKDVGGEELVRAVHDVPDRRAGLAPSGQRRLLEQLMDQPERGPGPSREAPTGRRRQKDSLPDGPTEREAEVLALVADGLSHQENGVRLSISTAHVKTRINNHCAKAEVRDRAHAVRYAYRHGLVAPPGRTIT